MVTSGARGSRGSLVGGISPDTSLWYDKHHHEHVWGYCWSNGKVAEQEDNGQIPRGYILGVYGIEEWRIDDGSFVKLREVSLSYVFRKIRFLRDITVSLSGRNLISWDKYKGYDPEVNAGGQSTILRGIDFGSVPIPRTFSLAIQTKF